MSSLTSFLKAFTPIIVVVFSSGILIAQDAKDIINKYLDTVSNGDVKNWQKIRSAYKESMSYFGVHEYEQGRPDFSQRPSYSKYYFLAPDKSKNELYNDSTFSTLTSTFYFFKEKKVIFIGNMPSMEVPNKEGEYQSQFQPVKLNELMHKSESIKLIGIKDFGSDAEKCYEIEITTKDKTEYYYFNVKTYLLEYSSNADHSILSSFTDYKKIGDCLYPMSTTASKNGVVYFWMKNKKVQFNVDIDESIFRY